MGQRDEARGPALRLCPLLVYKGPGFYHGQTTGSGVTMSLKHAVIRALSRAEVQRRVISGLHD